VGDDHDVHETTSATATFLFTDIEGSTDLLKALRGVYAKLLADHHSLLREAFDAYGGREVDNQGDSFFVAFTRAKDAVLAAAAAQRALAEQAWPAHASVRVRMGIHTGEAAMASDRYVGLSVHRAARISAVAHGGQVLVSPTTASLLEDDDELPGVALKDIGVYRLKDIARPVRLHQLQIDGLPQTFPRLKSSGDTKPNRRKRAAVVAALVLVAAVAAVAVAVMRGDDAPPRVVANSLVRIDPDTLEPTDVVPIPAASAKLVAAGGFLWITHHLYGAGGVRNAGDRTLTRVDPATGDVVTVGGGLAPCGLTADPSGDVWVANCYLGERPAANVVRVDATTLRFEATWRVPGGTDIYRGLIYGGGSLWASEAQDPLPQRHAVVEVDPQTGRRRSIRILFPSGPLAWSGGYGDLWVSNFGGFPTLTKIHASTEAVQLLDAAFPPGAIIVDGDTVWVADFHGPHVERLSAVDSRERREISLPARNAYAGVWSLAAGEGYVWAVTPRVNALWRIDPKTNAVTRIRLPHGPTDVATSAGAVWVIVRR
jgi:class 3 adenylate cyclase/streptogramin lyase